MPKKPSPSQPTDAQILAALRRHLAADFSNRDRHSCPSHYALKLLALRPLEVRPAVIEHAFSCSPCFQKYADYLPTPRVHVKPRR